MNRPGSRVLCLAGDAEVLLLLWRDPVSGEETETFVPGVLKEKGIRFALSSEDPNSRSLAYQAALAIARGLTRASVQRCARTTAARISCAPMWPKCRYGDKPLVAFASGRLRSSS